MPSIMITTHIQSWNSSLITIKLNWSQQLCTCIFVSCHLLKWYKWLKQISVIIIIHSFQPDTTHAPMHTHTNTIHTQNNDYYQRKYIYQWSCNICLQITFIPHTKVLREISYAVWKRLFAWKIFNKADLLHCSIENSNFCS